MAARIVKNDMNGIGMSDITIYPSILGDDFITIGVDSEGGGRYNTQEVLEAIYEAAPSHAPDGWKPTPKWADARVIEGTDSEGDRRVLVRAYATGGGEQWVTDAAIHWSRATAERQLTDVRILVGADDD